MEGPLRFLNDGQHRFGPGADYSVTEEASRRVQRYGLRSSQSRERKRKRVLSFPFFAFAMPDASSSTSDLSGGGQGRVDCVAGGLLHLGKGHRGSLLDTPDFYAADGAASL